MLLLGIGKELYGRNPPQLGREPFLCQTFNQNFSDAACMVMWEGMDVRIGPFGLRGPLSFTHIIAYSVGFTNEPFIYPKHHSLSS